jgi:N-acetylglucosaminyldiphosphoundecaprenol N-acetyl-beta-D-mannosaminyltransferase
MSANAQTTSEIISEKHVEMTPHEPKVSKCNILDIDFDLIDYDRTIQTIEQCRRNGKKIYVTMTNPHSVMICHRDTDMKQATAGAHIILPDGAGIILAAKLLGYPDNGRTTGPMLMLRLCNWGRQKGYRHFFYGGAQAVAQRLADKLSGMYSGLDIVGTYCPPFRPLSPEEDQFIIDTINATSPDIVWVGLGAPKQEKWMADHLGKIRATAMIGVGAAFDFHSGNIRWAPGWIRKIGLEWAYRLGREPKRMWRRNLDSPLFLARVIAQRFKSVPVHNPQIALQKKTQVDI